MKLRLFFALSLSLPVVAFAQTPATHPMTFADLQALHRISDPQVSPSHKWVIFSSTDVDLAKNTKTNHLWLVPFAGGAQAQLTKGAGESNGRFSPDGKWLMYSADDDGKGEIFIAPWDDAKGELGKAHAVTHLETEADGAIWAPDSDHFLFVSNVYAECESHAALGEARAKEEADCNAKKDAAAAKDPVHALVFDHLLYRHWNAYQGPKHSHIFYASIKGGTPRDLTPASVVSDHEAPTFSLGGPTGFSIAPDGKEVAYVVNLDKVPAESTNNDIFVLDPNAEPSTAKKVSTAAGSDDGPLYSPDGKWLAWRSQARNGYESDKFDLVVMDRASGKITNLSSKFANWVDAFTWVDDSQHIVFASAYEGMEPLYETNITGDDLKTFGKDGGEWGDFSALTVDGQLHIVGTRMWVDHPTAVFNIEASRLMTKSGEHSTILGLPPAGTFDKDPGNLQLSHINGTVLHSWDLGPSESFWFAGANGARVEGFLVKPPHFDPNKKYPLKFLVHGGPQGAWGDAWSYRWNPELFAANGYVVVMINPRGSTGYGQRFLEEVSGDWGGRPYVDLMKGLDYVEAHYPFIDKARECELGASYGGFMSDWILTHTDRFKCIVTHDGMYDPESAFGTTEELWFNEWEFRPLATKPGQQDPDAVVEQTKPAHPWDFYNKPASEDPFRKWSPMLNIKNAKTPTLIIHSQRDYRLDVSEGLQLFTALQLLNVPSKMLYFPDEGHWVLKPQNSQLWYATVNDWVDRWTHTNQYADGK